MNEHLTIDVVTLFPEMFRGALDASIPARAAAKGLVEVRLHPLREHGIGAHRQVDDAPFGGGAGMVLKPEPLFSAVEAITGRAAGEHAEREAIVLLTPSGEPFTQARAHRFAGLSRLVLLCGRYEGVDDRVRTHLCTETLSLGDFVLSGGEPAAVAVIDAVIRLVPGALGNERSAGTESFEDGLLEAPHFTRPAEFRGLAVPSELLTGNHAAIARWRSEQSRRLTRRVRPEMLGPSEETAGAGRAPRRAGSGCEISDTTLPAVAGHERLRS